MKNVALIIFGLVLFSSCEKVIDVPLNEADRRVVVEGALYDIPFESSVKISKTGSVYDDAGFEKVSGAVVTVTDDLGNVSIFAEDPTQPGFYTDINFIAQPNRTYSLSIDSGGEIYTAESTTSSPVQFDTLYYQEQTGRFGQMPGDTNYFTFYSFTDNGNEANYYRAVPFKNGVPGQQYLNDDKLNSGEGFTQPFFADQFGPKDTLTAYLISMDEFVYRYFFSLDANQDGGQFAPTPANPVSNLNGDAIGYFGAFMTDVRTIIYP